MNPRKLLVTFALLLVTCFFANSSAAAATVNAFRGAPVPDTTRTDSFAQAGWGFYANSPFTTKVNQLGFWVSPANSGNTGVLAADHEVALYHYAGGPYEQIASVTILAGSTADANGYAWASIPEVTLSDPSQGGDYYIVTAEMGTDVWGPNTGFLNAPTLDPTFGTLTQNGWISLDPMPGDGNTVGLGVSGLNGGYIGGNIGYAAVPEPSSFVLAAIGLAGLAMWRRRKRDRLLCR